MIGVYVNLLENPERFTGYGGPSAKRVWDGRILENCFTNDGNNYQCLEKRIFYRVMSGLRTSISTHIAREYYYADEDRWGANIPLFIRAVGLFPDRLNNMYFTFLFLLRSTIKAKDALLSYQYHTGNVTDDISTKNLTNELFSSLNSINITNNSFNNHVNECRNGFDESSLFQIKNPLYYDNDKNKFTSSLQEHQEKQQLLNDFRLK